MKASDTRLADAAVGACHRLLGATVTRVGDCEEGHRGSLKRSLRLQLGRRAVIVSRRADRLEAKVLKTLGGRGLAVPRLLAYDGVWLIQEDVPGTSLARRLGSADEATAARLIEAAVSSLTAIQAAGRESGLATQVPGIGTDPTSIQDGLLSTPAALASAMALAPPPLPADALLKLLLGPHRDFVKWNTDPETAVVREHSEEVVWVDWSDCGRRNALDDLAWLLSSEHLPASPRIERLLLARHLYAFAGDCSPRAATRYLAVMVVLLVCRRLRHLVGLADSPLWADGAASRKAGRPDSHRACALILARRGAQWAGREPLTEAMTDWFAAISERLEQAPQATGGEGAELPAPRQPAPHPPGERFLDPAPEDLTVGDLPLRAHLEQVGEREALTLRQLLDEEDWSDLEARYPAVGRAPQAPAAMVGLILYGLLQGANTLRGLERLARVDLGAMWVTGGLRPDRSTLARFVHRHESDLDEARLAALAARVLARAQGDARRGASRTVARALALDYRDLVYEAARTAAESGRCAMEATRPPGLLALKEA